MSNGEGASPTRYANKTANGSLRPVAFIHNAIYIIDVMELCIMWTLIKTVARGWIDESGATKRDHKTDPHRTWCPSHPGITWQCMERPLGSPLLRGGPGGLPGP